MAHIMVIPVVKNLREGYKIRCPMRYLQPGDKGFNYFLQINLGASERQKTDFFSCDQVLISVCLR